MPLAGAHPLALSVMQQFLLTESAGARGPWKVHTTAYLYELRPNNAELLVYHWHPSGVSPQTSPHLHIGPAADVGFKPLQGAHVPTGRIALEESYEWRSSSSALARGANIGGRFSNERRRAMKIGGRGRRRASE